jgi:hypothetical protein
VRVIALGSITDDLERLPLRDSARHINARRPQPKPEEFEEKRRVNTVADLPRWRDGYRTYMRLYMRLYRARLRAGA